MHIYTVDLFYPPEHEIHEFSFLVVECFIIDCDSFFFVQRVFIQIQRNRVLHNCCDKTNDVFFGVSVIFQKFRYDIGQVLHGLHMTNDVIGQNIVKSFPECEYPIL